jgi:lipoprotein-anchoring transpeptidase ErfK/SrfK
VRRVKPLHLVTLAAGLLLAACAKDTRHAVKISVKEQRMAVYDRGVEIARYDVSTSKFGLGDRPGSRATPLGKMEVAKKIGGGAPIGMKFKNRRPTGEVVPINAPGRDPIVTRILWLKGKERQNAKAYGRAIYIHGTAEESKIGTPASYGCIRMRSADVVKLYSTLGEGAKVEITTAPLPAPAPVVRAGEQKIAAHTGPVGQ